MSIQKLRYDQLSLRVTHSPPEQFASIKQSIAHANQQKVLSTGDARALLKILKKRIEIRDSIENAMEVESLAAKIAYLQCLKKGSDPMLVATDARHAHNRGALTPQDMDYIQGTAVIASCMADGRSLPMDLH